MVSFLQFSFAREFGSAELNPSAKHNDFHSVFLAPANGIPFQFAESERLRFCQLFQRSWR